MCAAAVILPAGIVIEGLNDSKKLSEKKREKLFDEITENALAWSVSLVDERVIDEINILQATYRAMKQAVDGLTRPADFVYVDGNRSQGLEQPHECVVSGDAKIPSVAAASIIAKVTRDRLMRRFAEQYRSTALKSTRATRLRRTMRHCSNTAHADPPDDLPQEILRKASGCTAMKGAWGEKAARLYLEKRGWHTTATNFRTRFGEIDIIAENAQYVIFAEVKTRKNARYGPACEAVTPAKQAKIIAAAQAWLQEHPTEKQPRFDVIEVYGEENALIPPRINHLENAFGG